MGFIVNSQVPINVAFLPVGSPTITDGVVTGFSPSDYVQTNQIPDLTGTFDLRVCGSINYSPTNNDYWLPILVGSGISVGIGMDRYAYLWISGTSTNSIADQLKGNKQYELNKEYVWSWKHTSGNYSLLYSEDNGQTWNTDVSISSNENITRQSKLRIGAPVIDRPYQYWRGYIDLNKCYLEINGQEWKYIPGSVEPQNIIIDDGTNQTSANYLILNDKLVWANHNIYIDVSNEQTNPTNFVRTNITLNSNSKVEMVFKPSQYSSNYALWCCRNDLQVKTLSMFNVEENYRFDYYSTQTNIGSSASLTKTNIIVDGNKAYVNDTLKATVTAQTFTSDYGMVLFASNTGGGTTYNNGYQGKFYSMKIYLDGTNLSYHFVPVPSGMTIGSYTTPSAGMFDLVNQQFYANSGSGTFTWGKD